jgi:regulator of sigma E protease
LRDQREKNQVTINNDGVLGVKLAGLSFASMEKLGYYKVSQQEFGFLESIPVGIIKEKTKW